ncbi:amidase [Streptacidiphilus sp. MAP12-20]|uniref:amidase n=1 Tax=Streptacidiphilus sp. MAP12-20 TaxID=3156299 RepID=UPI0035173B49
MPSSEPTSASIHEWDALTQAAAVRSGQVSPVELVDHYLDRIAASDDALGAFVTVTADAARKQARAAERRVRERPDELPPLFGVPTAIKDLVGTAGVTSSFGSRAFRDFVPAVDAHSVALLRAAGTISLGKTNTPEFGLNAYTDTDIARSARTPWDLSRSAGGSSGGAAAAVAAGLVPFAHGSDGGGSLRIPASACGVFGLKPSRGRVSSGPLGVDVTGLPVQGPIARTVRDAAAMLDALAVPMPGDAYWAQPLPAGETFLGWAGREPGRMRIARYADPGSTDFTLAPECRDAYEDAAALLIALGHEVVEIANPLGPELAEPFFTTWAVQSLSWPVPPEREPLLRPLTRWWRERGRATSADQFLGALSTLQLLARRAVTSTQEFDAVLTPTLAMPPQTPEWFFGEGPQADRRGPDFEAELARQTAFSPYTGIWNATGQPAASLPLWWTAEGLPIGVTLAGRPAGEGPLLSLCAQIEAARPWRDRWPAEQVRA